MCELRSKVKLMLLLLISICACFVNGYPYLVCKNKDEVNNTIVVSKDENIIGRYNIMWCLKDIEPTNVLDTTTWSIKVKINSTNINNRSECEKMDVENTLIHSAFGIDEEVLQKDCHNVCMNKTFDLMYTGCYYIIGELANYASANNEPRPQNHLIRYVENNYTKEHYYNYSLKKLPNDFYINSYLDFKLISQNDVPLTNFNIYMYLNKENDWKYKYTYPSPGSSNTSMFNCKLMNNFSVYCNLTEAKNQAWNATFVHTDYTPWSSAVPFVLDRNLTRPFTASYHYERDKHGGRGVEASGGVETAGWWVWAGGALAAVVVAAGAGGALLLYLRSRSPRSRDSSRDPILPKRPSPPPPKTVIILYEKDHDYFMSAMSSLINYIQQQGLTVIDIHSVETIAKMRKDGLVKTWVSRYVDDPDVFFLLVPGVLATHTLPLDSRQRRILKNMAPGSTALCQIIDSLQVKVDFPTTRYLVAQINIPDTPYEVLDIVPYLDPFYRINLPEGLKGLLKALSISVDDCTSVGNNLSVDTNFNVNNPFNEVSLELRNYIEMVQENPKYFDDFLMHEE